MIDLDIQRKDKVFQIAKSLKKNCFQLHVEYDEDAKEGEQWIVVCIALIDGQPFHSANHLDLFTPLQHADLFRHAFSKALNEKEKETKTIVTLH